MLARSIALTGVLALVGCQQTGLQRQDQFEWAMREAETTSPPIVRVRLSFGPNNSGMVRCVTSNMLLYAITSEMGLAPSIENVDKAMKVAINNKRQSFKFNRRRARVIVKKDFTYREDKMAYACRLIKAGQAVIISDLTQAVVKVPSFPRS